MSAPTPSERCWDCQVAVGQAHADECDWAVCLATGGQRLMCGGQGVDHDGGCGADVWSGRPSGEAEAAEFGWWIQDRTSEGLGFVPCAADAPGATPDTQRLIRDAVWDRRSGRWRRRAAAEGRRGRRPAGWTPPVPGAPDDAAPRDVHDRDDRDDREDTVGAVGETVPGETAREAPRLETLPVAVETDSAETDSATDGETGAGRRAAGRLWELAIGDLPSVWSVPPTEPAALVRYAAAGQWCSPDSRVLRFLGQAYCVLLAIPVSVALYVAAWLCQRPGRLAAAAVLAAIVWVVL